MTIITLTMATRKERPPTPVMSQIWMSAMFLFRAIPRAFQPKPVKTTPRSHSKAVHAADTSAATRRLFHDLIQTGSVSREDGRGLATVPAKSAQSAV